MYINTYMYMACQTLLYYTMLCSRHYLQSGHTNNNLQNGNEFDKFFFRLHLQAGYTDNNLFSKTASLYNNTDS